MFIQHSFGEIRCLRCNRVLTVDESVKNHLGPVCVKKQIFDLVVKKMANYGFRPN